MLGALRGPLRGIDAGSDRNLGGSKFRRIAFHVTRRCPERRYLPESRVTLQPSCHREASLVLVNTLIVHVVYARRAGACLGISVV